MNVFCFIRLLILVLIFCVVCGACLKNTDSVQIAKSSSNVKEASIENVSNEIETNNTYSINKSNKVPDSSVCNNENIDYKYSGLERLENIVLKQSEIEIRLVISGGIGLPHWFIFQKKKKVASAYIVAPLEEGKDNFNDIMKTIKLQKPPSGWSKFNAFLVSEGVSFPLKLTKSEKDYKDMDGPGIAVEIKAGNKYDCRWYNHSSKKGKELDKLLRSIAERLRFTDKFGYK